MAPRGGRCCGAVVGARFRLWDAPQGLDSRLECGGHAQPAAHVREVGARLHPRHVGLRDAGAIRELGLREPERLPCPRKRRIGHTAVYGTSLLLTMRICYVTVSRMGSNIYGENVEIAPNGACLAIRDADGRIAGEPEDDAELSEPTQDAVLEAARAVWAQCPCCLSWYQPDKTPGALCTPCQGFPLD